MEVMYVLIGFSLLVALVFLGAFIWSVKTGQYEDKYTPSVRMLFDDSVTAADEETTPDVSVNPEYRSKE